MSINIDSIEIFDYKLEPSEKNLIKVNSMWYKDLPENIKNQFREYFTPLDI